MKGKDDKQMRLEIIKQKKMKEHENSVKISRVITTILTTTEGSKSKIIMDFLDKKRKYENKISKKQRYLKEKNKLDDVYYSDYSPKEFMGDETDKVYEKYCKFDANDYRKLFVNRDMGYNDLLCNVFRSIGNIYTVGIELPYRCESLTTEQIKVLMDAYQSKFDTINIWLMNKILEYYNEEFIFCLYLARKVKLAENQEKSKLNYGELE